MINFAELTKRFEDSAQTVVVVVVVVYATAYEADAYMFYRCFFLFFSVSFLFFFVFLSVRQKNTRQPFLGTAERIFMKLLPNENVVSNVVPKWGLGPQIIFWGAKNYTLRTWC